MNKAFWNRKNVLVTGSEGFLGSNLTLALVNGGARVTGLDIRTNRRHSLLGKTDYGRFRLIRGSVANLGLVKRILADSEPEVIFHLGAEAIVGVCNREPLRAYKSNIEGTWNVLEASRLSGKAKAIVAASSDKAYGIHKVLPYREDAALKGTHPYDVSKSCADLICHTYFNTYGLPVAVTRCGNIYGPGDFNYSRLIPDAVRCALSGKTFQVRSDGKFTRDYVFVDDIVNGYVLLAEQLEKKKLAGEAFNFSDENPITVLEFLDSLYKALGKEPDYKVLNIAKNEIKHQYLASGKARRVLGWEPRHSLQSGLRKTVKWYTDYYSQNICRRGL